MMWGNGMGWGMGWMWIFGLLVLVGVISLTVALVLVLVKVSSSTPSNGGRSGTSRGTITGGSRGREILAERYARGEVSTEEYRERLLTLEEGSR